MLIMYITRNQRFLARILSAIYKIRQKSCDFIWYQ